MLKNCFYTLVIFAGAFTWVHCRRRINTTPEPPKVDNDVSSTTPVIFVEIMKTFRDSLQQLKYRKISLEDSDLGDILSGLPTANYPIEYGKISVTQDDEIIEIERLEKVEIGCEFSNRLQMRIPLPGFTFKGYFNIANGTSMPVEYKYTIVLNNTKLNYHPELNQKVDESASSEEKSRIDVSYEPIMITLEMPENNDYSAYEQVNSIARKIRSSMNTMLGEKLTAFSQNTDTDTGLLQICANPTSTFIARHHSFISNEDQQRFYYFINEAHVETCTLLRIQIDWIKLRGLWNFSSMTVKQTNPYNEVEFTLQIDSVEGETNWGYSVSAGATMIRHITNMSSNFTMNTMTISGTMGFNDNRLYSLNTEFEMSLEEASNNSSVALLNEILTIQLKTVIENSIRNKISNHF